jgi:hypothetical protein
MEVQPAKGPDQHRLALAGSRYLGAVGRAALGRGDIPAAVNLRAGPPACSTTTSPR